MQAAIRDPNARLCVAIRPTPVSDEILLGIDQWTAEYCANLLDSAGVCTVRHLRRHLTNLARSTPAQLPHPLRGVREQGGPSFSAERQQRTLPSSMSELSSAQTSAMPIGHPCDITGGDRAPPLVQTAKVRRQCSAAPCVQRPSCRGRRKRPRDPDATSLALYQR